MAHEFLFRFFRYGFVDFQRVIVKEFLAGFDIAHCVDEDAVVFLDGFAVWIAAMVHPARVVAADLRIDYLAAFKAEIECMRIVLLVGSALPGAALAGIFDDAGAFGDELRGVNAATVHAGTTNF